MKNKKMYAIIIVSLLSIVVITMGVYKSFYKHSEEEKKKVDLIQVSSKLFQEYMEKEENQPGHENIESSYNIKEIKIIAGDYREFVADINYDLMATTGNDTEVVNCKWPMRIKRISDGKYKVVDQGIHFNKNGLKPIKDSTKKEYIKSKEFEVSLNSPNKYTIRDRRVSVTYDNGKTWADVPVVLESLLSENALTDLANNVNENEFLEEGSYYITPEKTAFVYGNKDSDVKVTISEDKGKSWKTYEVQGSKDDYGYERKLVGFTSKNQGYVVLTTGVAMGHQENYIYETNDGGKTWKEIGNTNKTYARVVTGAGFASDKIILMCFRYESDNNPTVYRTTDEGKTWKKVYIKLPSKYKYDCATPLCPVFKGAKGVLPVKLRDVDRTIQFTTDNYGATWKFDKEINYSNEIKYKK